MNKKIAVFGGSFNPPGTHHRVIAEMLSRHFDEVVIVPCGPRPDKLTVGDIEPVHRAVMTDMAFRRLPKVRVELFDLEHATFTRTHRLEELFGGRGEVWHVVGTDLVQGGAAGDSLIHRTWERGSEVWKSLNFAVVARDGYELKPGDLPPRHRLFQPPLNGASSRIREMIFRRLPVDALVEPEVAAYIDRHNLYRGLPPRSSALRLQRPRARIVADERNSRAMDTLRLLSPLTDPDDPNCIIVIGGDGTMIRAIREHWRLRLPFIGINTGHIGHLLNDLDHNGIPDVLENEMRVHQLPLLYADVRNADGRVRPGGYAVNDAWVERAGGQAAWIQVKVNGRTRLPRLVADGALVATAAGSTAYARAMGASPVLVGTPEMILIGSNVAEPLNWKSASLPLDTEVELEVLEPRKRPIRAYIDGADQGIVSGMSIRVSRIAAVEVAFSPQCDMNAKIDRHFFQARAR